MNSSYFSQREILIDKLKKNTYCIHQLTSKCNIWHFFPDGLLSIRIHFKFSSLMICILTGLIFIITYIYNTAKSRESEHKTTFCFELNIFQQLKCKTDETVICSIVKGICENKCLKLFIYFKGNFLNVQAEDCYMKFRDN